MNATAKSNPIRSARTRRRLTQAQLAEQVGVTKGAISQWEQGATRPMPDTALKLLEILPGLRLEHIYRAATG
jgi:transcriptional regulator with XRE-family HTH domain